MLKKKVGAPTEAPELPAQPEQVATVADKKRVVIEAALARARAQLVRGGIPAAKIRR